MTDQDFDLLSKETLLEGAKLCFQNAKIHYDTSISLAKAEMYGIANSHVILSSEECIKCMILMAGFFNVKLPFKVEPFFYSHFKRHQQAAEIQPFIEDLCLLGDAFNRIFKARKPSRFGMAFDVVLSVTLLSIFKSITRKEAKDFTDFWGKANNQKNLGFYVDYTDGCWLAPSTIDKSEFL